MIVILYIITIIQDKCVIHCMLIGAKLNQILLRGNKPIVQGQHGGLVLLFLWSTMINHLSSELSVVFQYVYIKESVCGV